MAQGQIYVEVDANSVSGGVMPMAIVSGNPEPIFGQEHYGVWIRWWYDDTTGEGGFTGAGWFWEDNNNILNELFDSEESFKTELVTKKPQNLDNYLGRWNPDEKTEFYNRNQDKLGLNHCFYIVAG